MKIVIDIPEEVYNHTQEYEVGGFNQENDTKLFMAIKNGTPLPKGHWIQTDNYFSWRLNYVECSCCHKCSREEGDYCPNCGAKMNGGNEK